MKLIKLKDVSLEPVSHDPQIMKQVIIDEGIVPGLTKFSRAVIKAGQKVSPHSHDTMFEVMFFIGGRGESGHPGFVSRDIT